MRYDERYDRGFRGYDRPGPGRRPRGYAADYRRGPDRGYGPGYPASFADPSFAMGPGFMPVGWGWFGPMGMDPAPFAWGPPAGFGPPPRPPRRPEDSPAYGRGGDRELQRWARERGYDVGHAIYPRGPRRHR
ncbi:MAG: hypothetical protein AB1941_12825 [Gemmatimonadota bacterium]